MADDDEEYGSIASRKRNRTRQEQKLAAARKGSHSRSSNLNTLIAQGFDRKKSQAALMKCVPQRRRRFYLSSPFLNLRFCLVFFVCLGLKGIWPARCTICAKGSSAANKSAWRARPATQPSHKRRRPFERRSCTGANVSDAASGAS